MDSLSCFLKYFRKDNNFCDFLFASPDNDAFLQEVSLKEKNCHFGAISCFNDRTPVNKGVKNDIAFSDSMTSFHLMSTMLIEIYTIISGLTIR